jgi:hypothetical protein
MPYTNTEMKATAHIPARGLLVRLCAAEKRHAKHGNMVTHVLLQRTSFSPPKARAQYVAASVLGFEISTLIAVDSSARPVWSLRSLGQTGRFRRCASSASTCFIPISFALNALTNEKHVSFTTKDVRGVVA